MCFVISSWYKVFFLQKKVTNDRHGIKNGLQAEKKDGEQGNTKWKKSDSHTK